MNTDGPNNQDIINAATSAASGVPKPIIDAATTPPPSQPSGDGVDEALDQIEGSTNTGGVWGRPRRQPGEE